MADLEVQAAEVKGALAQLESARHYLCGRYFAAQVIEGVREAVAQEQSPFVNRRQAAVRWFCSEDEVSRAAKAGILTAYKRGASPLFEKAEGDAAIRQGKWKRTSATGADANYEKEKHQTS